MYSLQLEIPLAKSENIDYTLVKLSSIIKLITKTSQYIENNILYIEGTGCKFYKTKELTKSKVEDYISKLHMFIEHEICSLDNNVNIEYYKLSILDWNIIL